jgi:glycosyltransferase involved in cell wall biosynthesis
MNNSNTEILAVIPAYNEEHHIANVVTGALEYLHVLVIDDGSSDATAEIAKSAGALIQIQDPNQGKGIALQSGFKMAIEGGYQAVVTLDADGQHDPAEIPKFLHAYQADHSDLVIGKRDFSQMPLARRISNSIGSRAFSWALGQDVPDNQSGYRLISQRLMTAVLESQETGFEFEVEMIKICVRNGFKLAWVPIRTIYAGETSHIQPLRHIKEFLRILWQTRRGT